MAPHARKLQRSVTDADATKHIFELIIVAVATFAGVVCRCRAAACKRRISVSHDAAAAACKLARHENMHTKQYLMKQQDSVEHACRVRAALQDRGLLVGITRCRASQQSFPLPCDNSGRGSGGGIKDC